MILFSLSTKGLLFQGRSHLKKESLFYLHILAVNDHIRLTPGINSVLQGADGG